MDTLTAGIISQEYCLPRSPFAYNLWHIVPYVESIKKTRYIGWIFHTFLISKTNRDKFIPTYLKLISIHTWAQLEDNRTEISFVPEIPRWDDSNSENPDCLFGNIRNPQMKRLEFVNLSHLFGCTLSLGRTLAKISNLQSRWKTKEVLGFLCIWIRLRERDHHVMVSTAQISANINQLGYTE
jgi:hypothetical protein